MWHGVTKKPGRRGKKALAVPFDVVSLRDRIMELAGVSMEERVRLFKLALEKLTGLLDAKETKFFSYMGNVVTTEEVANLALQRKAALDLVEIIGGETKAAGEGQKKGGGPVSVTIKKFVVNVVDSQLPGAPAVVVESVPEGDVIDLAPDPLPAESVVSTMEEAEGTSAPGPDPDDRVAGSSHPGCSPLLDGR
jgi:hypothetical protein